MQLRYRHTSRDLTLAKLALAAAGLGLALALGFWPPRDFWWHVGLWVLAGSAGFGGLLALMIRPRVYLVVTDREIVLDPDGPFRRIPLRHVHHAEFGDGPDGPVVTLQLRNGDRIDISGRIGRRDDLQPLLAELGIMTRVV